MSPVRGQSVRSGQGVRMRPMEYSVASGVGGTATAISPGRASLPSAGLAVLTLRVAIIGCPRTDLDMSVGKYHRYSQMGISSVVNDARAGGQPGEATSPALIVN